MFDRNLCRLSRVLSIVIYTHFKEIHFKIRINIDDSKAVHHSKNVTSEQIKTFSSVKRQLQSTFLLSCSCIIQCIAFSKAQTEVILSFEKRYI